MKKILFYITYFPGYGGIEKVTALLAECLAGKGYKVRILSFRENSGGRLPLPENIPTEFMPDSQNFGSERNRRFLREYLAQHRFDRIIYQDCYSPVHELLFGTDFPVRERLIVAEHNSPLCYLAGYENYWRHLHWFSLHGFPRKLAYFVRRHQIRAASAERHRMLLENCERYVLLSEAYREQLHELVGGGFDDRIGVIPNPVVTPRKAGISMHKEQVVLFVGRLVRDKGVDYLLKIWKQVARVAPGWRLVVAGDGELRTQMERSIGEQRIERIELVGAQPDMRPFYERASVLVMTSLFEGFPLVLLEAMDHGCVPVVFDSFAALNGVVEQERNGIRVAPYDVGAFAGALSKLLDDPARRAAMSCEAMRTAAEYAPGAICEKWCELIR